MRTFTAWLLGMLLICAAPIAVAATEPTTDAQKTLYALGMIIGQNLGPFELTQAELDVVKTGLTDTVLKKPGKVDLNAFMPKIQQLQQQRVAATAATEKKSGQAFADKAATEKGATKTGSGLVISTLKPGNGGAPKDTDSVRVHYHGTLTDGTVFDSSVQRGQPATFALNGVIPCFREGVQLMKVGGKSRLVCPATLAYGDRGAPPKIRPGATLVFEVELLEIVK